MEDGVKPRGRGGKAPRGRGGEGEIFEEYSDVAISAAHSVILRRLVEFYQPT